jgi:hypothetical protein
MSFRPLDLVAWIHGQVWPTAIYIDLPDSVEAQ